MTNKNSEQKNVLNIADETKKANYQQLVELTKSLDGHMDIKEVGVAESEGGTYIRVDALSEFSGTELDTLAEMLRLSDKVNIVSLDTTSDILFLVEDKMNFKKNVVIKKWLCIFTDKDGNEQTALVSAESETQAKIICERVAEDNKWKLESMKGGTFFDEKQE